MGDIRFFDMTYEDVIRKYKQTVGAVCVMRLKNYADAEDCFQNTFFILYRNAPHFESETHLKAWLIRVAINECNRYIRKNKSFVSLEKTNADSVHKRAFVVADGINIVKLFKESHHGGHFSVLRYARIIY